MIRVIFAAFSAIFLMLPASAYAQAAGQCLSREQVLSKGTVFAEAVYEEIVGTEKNGAPTRDYLYIGDPQKRTVSGYGTIDVERQCFKKRHAGFGWFSENVRKRSKRVGLDGVALSQQGAADCGDYNRQNGAGRCMASMAMVKDQLAKKRRPVAMAIINQNWSVDGQPIYEQPMVLMMFAEKRGEALSVLTKPVQGNLAVELARGKLLKSIKVEGDAAPFADWKFNRPNIPGDSVLRTVFEREMERNPAAACTPASRFSKFGKLVFSATSPFKTATRYRIYAASNGEWVLAGLPRAGVRADCFTPMLFGTDFQTADYIRDRFTQPSAIALPNFDDAGNRKAVSLCNTYKYIHANVAGAKLPCNSFSGLMTQTLNAKPAYGVAFQGRVSGAGQETFLTGLANKNGSLVVLETDASGVSQRMFRAKQFEFSSTYQQRHFSGRRAGIRQENTARAKAQQIAREERKRRADERARASLADDRRSAMRQRVRETPQRRAALQAIDRVIYDDSQSWWFNRYNPGTTRNLYAWRESGRSGATIYQANYTYNDTATGSVKVRMIGDYVSCIQFGDTLFEGCRPPRKGVNMTKMSLALTALALIALDQSAR